MQVQAQDWTLAFCGADPELRETDVPPSEPAFDRAAHLRADDRWRGQARVLPVWRGKVLVTSGGALAWLDPGHPALADAEPPILLGTSGGDPVAAQDLSAWAPPNLPETQLFLDPTEQHHPDIPEARFVELRGMLTTLPGADGELAATGRALTGWHAGHRFCPACGHDTAPAQSGWQRRCASCGAVQFPRTDPVVIMLIERNDRLLLGRSPGWPEGMYSCLAGFVEPGETVEAAVRREVAEETGVVVGPVRYVTSQPWPFPASLMLGCVGEALTDDIRIDPVELDDAMWLDRGEMAQVMAGAHPSVRAPRKGPIAGWLMARWLRGMV
ncbi:NAD(+) diphosphatase [uncultured Paracoccus sp.]|uniref:NAD(+) diphosphatase n=1 Tax=uncultured Paracoccus sp. TaxID=189685 RepID=UPI00261187E7|nr:NAD(+) diphosphatase [uncultured Paracoccus sp.]